MCFGLASLLLLELVYNSFPSNAIIEKPFCHILQAPPPRKSEEELREEEELQLALALSQSEAEHKKVCVVELIKSCSSKLKLVLRF